MSIKKICTRLARHTFKVRLSVLAVAAAASFTGCAQKAASSAEYIGIDAAKEAALKAAGISADQATLLSAGLDNQNETFYYQVVFQGNGMEYEFDIDALTGVVIEENHTPLRTESPADTSGSASGATFGATGAAALQENNGSGQNAAPGSLSAAGIDSDTALSLALSHAGLTEADIMYHQVKDDIEDGKRVFEVEFVTSDGTEYDYELSAEDGTVLSYDYDAEFQFSNVPPAGAGIISEDQAKQAVLDRVPGASADNIIIRLEEDDGRLEYEGKLFYDNTEYEFKIDAYSGGLMEWEAE